MPSEARARLIRGARTAAPDIPYGGGRWMGHYEWKQSFMTRLGMVGGAFVAGMVLEALRGYSPWGPCS
jgi:hypothetical protein